VERLISFVGLLVMILLAWLMSSHKRKFPWRMAVMGVGLQFVLAWLTIKTLPGQLFFKAIGDFIKKLLDFTDKGSAFVFGENFAEHFFAFKVLPTIIFFSCLMTMMYYLGVMQWMVKAMAFVMQKTLGTSGAETLSASANIFLGQTEAPLVIKPYLPTMTMSELNAVMISGFAGVSGGVLAAFAGMGIDAGHLVTASVISAPASLLLAKVMLPETEKPATLGVDRIEPPPVGTNLLEAAAIGAGDGLKLALNVAAMLIAFIALIELLNWGVEETGDGVAFLTGWKWADTWSLQNALGGLFAPLAWVMGIEWNDSVRAGELLGLKTFANEFVAYSELGEWLKADKGTLLEMLKATGDAANVDLMNKEAVDKLLEPWMVADRAAIADLVARAKESGFTGDFIRTVQPRTVTILTYALCGFSNFSSIGIQIGGLGAMAPERQSDFARLGLKAMICGALATCMTACVAGILI
jgi:CNT family concentrative nucleoside transporter